MLERPKQRTARDACAFLVRCCGLRAERWQAEVARLKAELETSSKAHRDDEIALRKKRTKSEQEVANWVAEYDKDMGARPAVRSAQLRLHVAPHAAPEPRS